jgi:hypothetical protein
MLSTGLVCFLESLNAFDRVGILLYRVEMLSIVLEYLCTGLECLLEEWNAFYKIGMLSSGLEFFRQSWSNFVLRWNAF